MKNILWAIAGIALIIAIVLLAKKYNTEEKPIESDTNSPSKISLLTSHDWKWEQTVFADGSIMKPKKPDAFTVHFNANGNINGTTDCNSWSSTYTIGEDSTIRLTPVISTLMFCTDSQESPYLSGIEGVDMFRVENPDKLTLLVQVDNVGTVAAMTFVKLGSASSHTDWKSKTENGRTFEYPNDFGTKYISIVDWPPVLNISKDKYSCTQAGNEVERAGQTEEKIVNGHKYCVTKVSDGAAGSTYTQYAYARPNNSGSEILTFTLRLVNCGNYNEPEMSACQAERDAFDPGTTIDQIFQTLK